MNKRISDHPIAPLFLERWSPRAFDGQAMSEADLLTLVEAARWAPSAYNYQPWRFVYALRDDAHWQRFVDLLVPFNAAWAQHASALVFVLSDTVMLSDGHGEAQPSHSHSFDTGAAWAQFALQAAWLGLQARGMAGINFVQSRERLKVPERFRIEMAIAVGRSAEPTKLSDELLKHETENQRRSVEEIAFAGLFPA